MPMPLSLLFFSSLSHRSAQITPPNLPTLFESPKPVLAGWARLLNTTNGFVPQLSAERDDLMEENERSAARLDQLTTALQEQREEKACVTNKVLVICAHGMYEDDGVVGIGLLILSMARGISSMWFLLLTALLLLVFWVFADA